MKKGIGLFILFSILSFSIISCGEEKKADTKETVKEEVNNETVAATEEVAEISFDLEAGKATYDKFCFACHKDGIAGSPKLGDKELWGPRAEKGWETLVKHVTEGYTGDAGIMPPMGTCMDCSEEDFKNAISYMMNEAGLSVK